MLLIRSSSLIMMLVAIFAAADSLNAQSNVKTGARGGLNFATFSEVEGDYEVRTGFVLGGFAKFDIPLSPFAIQPEALYSQKGAVMDGDEIRIDYIEFPVMLKYTVAPAGVAQPNIFAGPYAGVRLIAEADGDTGGLFPGGSTNLENDTESIDYGGVVGAGIDVEVGSSIFTADVRYSLGFRDVFRESEGKNGVFAVTVGISLPGL